MKITVLVENVTTEDFLAEHGLSLFIEYKDKTYLLDAGQTDCFMENANKLGIDLSGVSCAFLSHGHYDHAGGFAAFIEKNKEMKIYAMEDIVGRYFSNKGGMHEIGVPKEVYPQLAPNFELINSVTQVSEGVYLVPHSIQGLDKIGERTGLFKMENGAVVPDDFRHEISLVLEEPDGLVIINSCSHGGVINIISEVKNVFVGKRIKAFVGGLHMMGMRNGEEYCTFSDDEINEMSEFLEKENVDKIYTGHCTGLVGYEKLRTSLCEEKVEYLLIGKIISI